VKYIVIFSLFIFTLNAQDILISDKNINYKEILDKNNLGYIKSNKNIRCNTFDMKLLDKNKYQAKHFIFKGKAICSKDVAIVVQNKIQYDFGNIVIQRDGKVLSENNDYVKIKNYDGSIEKIYKNGQK